MTIKLPQLYEGESNAGLVMVDGKPGYWLILLPHVSPDLKWQDAIDWARSVGGELPTRFESALLYANVRDQIDTDYWYWTATPDAGYDDCALVQDIDYGDQFAARKDEHFRARAVRRVELKP